MNFSLFAFVRNCIDACCQVAKQRLRQWTKLDNQALALSTALDVTRSRSELVLENMLLRQQLIVLKRKMRRPPLGERDPVLFVLLASKLRGWKQAVLAEKCHPLRNQLLSPSNPKELSILSSLSLNG